ncbi:MAG: 3',5'-cyclic-AMP phosphodiesterase [Candidatus Endonucleobacter sp. (ex Gigantidas childressi)]|nr:3',5'-cyclic-AMP phosphodiesterase [Candidatus Endonucleobacter sp. (ex Gigantidas childressi)]
MNQFLRIIQLSDTHLFATDCGQVHGVNTHASLSATIKHLQNRFTDAIDAIVITGDISQDETPASYQRLINHLTPLATPFYWLPGNHDILEVMTKACPQAVIQCVEMRQWQLLMLDSKSSGEVSGRLTDQTLSWLKSRLSETESKNTIIAMHHHPYKTGSKWMNHLGLQNAFQFQEIISDYSNIKAVIHGHIHQQAEVFVGNIPCFATPSTCAQFKANSPDFQIDHSQATGYRILELHNNGRLETSIVRAYNHYDG